MTVTSERDLVERRAHIRLPEGARDLHVHTDSGADTAIWVRFVMPDSARPQFLRDAGYPETMASTRRYVRNDQLRDQAFWNPDGVAQFESGQLLREQGKPRYGSNLLMGRQGDEWAVYLFVTSL